MSETIEPTGDSIELPSEDEIKQRMGKLEQYLAEVEQRGVPIEFECRDCGDSVVHPILPEE